MTTMNVLGRLYDSAGEGDVLNPHLFTKLIVNADEETAQPTRAKRARVFMTMPKDVVRGGEGVVEALRLENLRHHTRPSYTLSKRSLGGPWHDLIN